MDTIRKLSSQTIGKIAAGEVVERPAAAIKEMVENSIDAGASAITIEIRQGGIEYIRIADNGKGIEKDQVRMAFERHATSKLSDDSNLYSIKSLGFRGEALPSIAAVSKLTCITRVKNEDHGIKLINHGGTIMAIEEASSPEGSTFIVEDMFYNTPVRLKFLKKPSFEAALVSDHIMRLILSRPDISFKFINNGKILYQSPGDGNLKSAIYSIYGGDLLENLYHVEGMQGGILLKGFVGVGESARGNRSHQSFFINGRFLQSVILSRGLEQATRERVTVGNFPICMLHITMAHSKVDVNVHPNKLEVRFQNELEVTEAIRDIIYSSFEEDFAAKHIRASDVDIQGEEALAKRSMTKNTEFLEEKVTIVSKKDEEFSDVLEEENQEQKIDDSELSEKDKLLKAFAQIGKNMKEKPVASTGTLKEGLKYKDEPIIERQKENKEPLITKEDLTASHPPYIKADTPTKDEGFIDMPAHTRQDEQAKYIEGQRAIELSSKFNVKVLGAVFNTYILLEHGDILLAIDQHAAHERLMYDELNSDLARNEASQKLLLPLIIDLTFKERTILFDNIENFEALGFEIEDFGQNTVQIRAVPNILGEPQAKKFLLDILDELDTRSALDNPEKKRKAIIQMACKLAVKGGEELSFEQIYGLIDQMLTTEVTPTCPHGRPIIIAIDKKEIEKRFKRIQ